MDRAQERRSAIEAAVADIREIERGNGVTRQSLERIKQRLMQLAARTDLFDPKDYPPPASGEKLRSCL